jgi:hypothetical protein
MQSAIIILEDRRPRLSRQTGFQPVSWLAIRFDMPNSRVINLEGKMKRTTMPFFLPRISRIEEDFADKIGLIY